MMILSLYMLVYIYYKCIYVDKKKIKFISLRILNSFLLQFHFFKATCHIMTGIEDIIGCRGKYTWKVIYKFFSSIYFYAFSQDFHNQTKMAYSCFLCRLLRHIFFL